VSKHQYEKHEPSCEQHCPICDGGLCHCVVCGGAEGTLTTECPGVRVSEAMHDSVYAGRLDFRDGQWIDIEVNA